MFGMRKHRDAPGQARAGASNRDRTVYIVGEPGPSAVPATAENFVAMCPEAAAALKQKGRSLAPPPPAEAEQAAAEVRELFAAVVKSPEAKGREELAQEIALIPGMTAERAKALLARAPTKQTSGFFAAMYDPDVPPDDPEPSDDPRQAAQAAVEAARNGGLGRE